MTIEERITQQARRQSDKILSESITRVVSAGVVEPKDLTFIQIDHLITRLEKLKKMHGDKPAPITCITGALKDAHWETVKRPIIRSLEEDIFNRIPEAV